MENILLRWSCFIAFIELYTCCIFCENFFDKRKIKYMKLLQIVGIAVISVIVTLLSTNNLVSQIESIVFTLIAIAMVLLLYKGSILRLISVTVIYACIVLACDAIVLTVYALISSKLLDEIMIIGGFYRLSASILSKFLLISIIFFMSKKRRQVKNVENKYWVGLLLLANFLLLMAYFLADLLIRNYSYKKMVAVIIFYYIIMIVVITSIIYLFIRIGVHQEQKKQYEMIQVTNAVLEKALYSNENTLAQWKKAQHDYKNNLICIKELLSNKEFNQLECYISELIHQSGEVMYQYKTGNKIADILFNQKLAIAKNLGIYVMVNVLFPKESNISDTDMCAIFGNALDNAIEGCKDCTTKQIRIVVKQIKGFLKIKIENTVKNNPLETNPHLSTTKNSKDSHGIGLKSIKQAIENNGGFIEISCKNNYFILQGIIPLENTTI